MPKLQVAVIGPGRLGLACADALIDESELGLAGVVRRPGAAAALPGRLQRFPVASHVRELEGVRATLVCVPADAVLGEAADNHRVAAAVAGVSGEYRGDNGASQHYVYVELERGAAF